MSKGNNLSNDKSQLSCEEIEKLIPWNTLIKDIAISLHSNINIYLPFTHYLKTLKDFELKLEQSTNDFAISMLNAALCKCIEILMDIDEPTYNKYHDYNSKTYSACKTKNELQKRVKVHYENNFNYPLSNYEKQVWENLELGFQEMKGRSEIDFNIAYNIHLISPITEVVQAIDLKKYIETKLLQTKPKKRISNQSAKKLNGPAFAFFCSIVHHSGILQRNDSESNTAYLERVSKHFNLSVPIKGRQYYKESLEIKTSDRRYKKMLLEIFPKIDSSTLQELKLYINNKTKMYA